MSRTVQTSSAKMKGKKEMPSFGQIRKEFDAFVGRSHPAVEVALKTTFGAVQGGGLGYLMGMMMQSSAQTLKQSGQGNPLMMGGDAAMTPIAQAKGLAALVGVSAGLSVALKKIRKGKEDIWSQMGAAAGGGAAFTIANGNYSIPGIVNSALLLGLFTGGATKLMEAFKPQHEEKDYERSKFMLQSLGLSKYDRNLKKGLLTDDTIMLWTESALRDAKIPPGPSLLILHHIDQYRRGRAPFDAPSKPPTVKAPSTKPLPAVQDASKPGEASPSA